MKSKKLLALLLAGLMTATAFAGCGGGGGTTSTDASKDGGDGGDTAVEVKAGAIVDESLFGDENNISLKVWAPEAANELVKKQIENFKAAYPGKTFKSIEVVIQGEDSAATQILNDAEQAADVFGFASDQLNKLTDAKVISEVAFSDYVSKTNTPETVTAATVNGKLFAYPETNDNGYYLVYDKSVVSDEQAKTLEGVLEACKAAGKKFIFDCGNGFFACTFAFTAGVKIDGFEEDGQTQKFVDYDEKEAVATLQAFSKLIRDYKGTFASLGAAQIASGFQTGTCGAGVDGSWNTVPDQEALKDNYGAAKLPTINVNGQDKQLISMFGYKYIGVNAASAFPASAQILALYLAGETCQKERVSEIGWGPSNLNVQQDEVVTSSPTLQAIMAQAQNAVPQVNIASSLWDPIGTLGSEISSDKIDPTDTAYFEDLLKQTVADIQNK
jgi:arabinogalactan oligomer/maltooligosaccharide transport system substrate-binding protein